MELLEIPVSEKLAWYAYYDNAIWLDLLYKAVTEPGIEICGRNG
jgi:hypothetical protein